MEPRAAIYTRLLRNDKGKVVDSTDQQEKRCAKYAQNLGYRVSLTLHEGEHGPEDERTELRRLRTELWKRNVDVVIAARPETLYMDTDRFVKLTKEISTLGARLEFVDIDVDDYLFEVEAW